MQPSIRQCLWCKAVLRGRIDKRYCNDDCRNRYHNQRNQGAYIAVNRINHALSRNRRILSDFLWPDKNSFVVSRENLLLNGFQFCYFTGMQYGDKNQAFYCCYEFAFRPLSENEFELVRNSNALIQ